MIDFAFHRLVKDMRSLQKEYFKTKDKEVLMKCKALEKEIDGILFKNQSTLNFADEK